MSQLAVTGLMLANVKNYGAKGDGIADDTAAVQGAINNAVSAGLGGVFFPPGVYIVSQVTGLTVNSAWPFRITGVGQASQIYVKLEDHASTPRKLLTLSFCNNVEIDHLYLEGNKAEITNPSTSSALIDVGRSAGTVIHDMFLNGSSGHDVIVGTGSGSNVASTTINDNVFLLSSNTSILTRKVDGLFIHNNQIKQNVTTAISWIAVNDNSSNAEILIRNNSFSNGTSFTDGINVQGCESIDISRNTFAGPGGESSAAKFINFESEDGIFEVTVADNSFSGNSQQNISFTPANADIGRVSIQGNELNDDVRFLGGGGSYLFLPVVTNNWGPATAVLNADYGNFPEPAIIVGGKFNNGAATSGGGTQYLGELNPNGNVTGYRGDTFTAVFGGPGNNTGTRYIKATGDNTNTGWVALANLGTAQIFTAGQAIAQSNLSDGTGIVVNGATSNNFQLQLTQNSTVAAPTNVSVGQTINIAVRQNGVGGFTLGFNAAYKFPGGAPTITPGANGEDMISCYVRAVSGTTATVLLCSIAQNHVV